MAAHDTAFSAAEDRLHFLDALRVAALGLLIVYHVGMVYVRWGFHVKATTMLPALEPWMRLLNPWRMSLLFVVSGAVTARLLRTGTVGFLGPRLRRLGAPLLAGLLVIVPPQSWFEVRDKFGYDGGYVAFLGRYLHLRGAPGFCDAAGHCLILPTWNHLWFLPYLMVYTIALWALVRRWPQALPRLGAWCAARLGVSAMLLLPIALLALLRWPLRPRFEVTHTLIDDVLGHAQYLPVFLLGALASHLPGAWTTAAAARWPALTLGLLAWALTAAELWTGPTARLAFAIQQWCGVVAALGFAVRHLNRDSAAWRWASARVFPVYVLHQTVLIALVVAWRPLRWPPQAEALALIAGTVLVSLALAEAIGRVRPLASWIGWRRERRA